MIIVSMWKSMNLQYLHNPVAYYLSEIRLKPRRQVYRRWLSC